MQNTPRLFCISLSLALGYGLVGCTTKSKDKNSPPPGPKPTPSASPTPGPTGTPTPKPTGTPTPDPQGDKNPPASLEGDWQAEISSMNYKGNLTYSFRKDGKVLLTLMTYSAEHKTIQAERHEFNATYFAGRKQIQLSYVKGTCPAPAQANSMMYYRYSDSTPDYLSLGQAMYNGDFNLRRLTGGLSFDIHTQKDIQGIAIDEGCFAGGRLEQFVRTGTGG